MSAPQLFSAVAFQLIWYKTICTWVFPFARWTGPNTRRLQHAAMVGSLFVAFIDLFREAIWNVAKLGLQLLVTFSGIMNGLTSHCRVGRRFSVVWIPSTNCHSVCWLVYVLVRLNASHIHFSHSSAWPKNKVRGIVDDSNLAVSLCSLCVGTARKCRSVVVLERKGTWYHIDQDWHYS